MSSPHNSPCAPSPRRTNRASAVITVLVLAAVTAVIASGFLFRSAQEAKLADRSFLQYAALNLAEAGVEDALYAINTGAFNSTNGWTLVSGSSTDYRKTITTGFNLLQGTGAVYIRADNATSGSPTIFAAGVITIPGQPKLLKQIRVGTAQRGVWVNAMVAKSTITFSGESYVDSYDSAKGPWDSATNRTDLALVGTTSTSTDPIVLGSKGSIYGYAATAGQSPNPGKDGKIYGATTPAGVKIDPTRVRKDFSANLPDVTAPTGKAIELGVLDADFTLPRVGDTPGTNGRYLYTTPSVKFDTAGSLLVAGPVDLIVVGDTTVAGEGIIAVGNETVADASLKLYTSGNVNLTNKGGKNHHHHPVALSIYGTAVTKTKSSQSIKIEHDEEFYGMIYAPNASLTLTSGGDIYGAAVAKTITLSKKATLHYDVQLASTPSPFALQGSSSETMRLNGWAELTQAPGSGLPFARDNRPPFNTLF